jgi:chloramphenicol-sensitive protein RarD
VVVFHERLRRAQVVALAFAFVAVVVLTIEAGRVPAIALILGFTWGCYGLLKRTVPLGSVESLTAETLVLLPLALAIVAVVESGGDAIHEQASGLQLALVVGTGVITVGPLLLFAYAAPRVPFTVLGPMQYAVPTINFALGTLVYDEAMPALRIAGFALVWVALVVFSADTVRSVRATRAADVAQRSRVAATSR